MQASNSGATQRDRAGRDIASFLLGIPVSVSIDNPTEYDISSVYHALFVQDDFRVTQKMTLNLGLRYELESGVREAQGRIVMDFDLAVASPIRAQALANFNAIGPGTEILRTTFENLSGGLVFAGDSNAAGRVFDGRDSFEIER